MTHPENKCYGKQRQGGWQQQGNSWHSQEPLGHDTSIHSIGGVKRHSNTEVANFQLNIQGDNEHIRVCNDRTDCFASACVIDNEQLNSCGDGQMYNVIT